MSQKCLKYQSHNTSHLKVMHYASFQKVGQTSRSKSQRQTLWNQLKGLVSGEILKPLYISLKKNMAKAKVFKKKIEHQSNGHIKNFGIIQKIWQKINYYKKK
jgi:hypothetical protein